MKIIDAVIGWIDDNLPIFGFLIMLLTMLLTIVIVCVAIYQATDRASVSVRVYCVTNNGRPEVLYDGVARVSSRNPTVTLTDVATGRQVILVNATCRISELASE
jgi:hypothetical protein